MHGVRPLSAKVRRSFKGLSSAWLLPLRPVTHLWLATASLVGCQDAASVGASPPGATREALPEASPACDSGPLTDAEKIRAAKLIQSALSTSHGKVVVTAIQPVSGVIRAMATPAIAGARPFPMYVTRDLRILFPAAQDTSHVPAQARAPGTFESCLRASGLRLYGDAKQAATKRQLQELGHDAAALLVDCATHPAECASLGQTTLPMMKFGPQRIASFMPRKVIGQWTQCDPN